MKDENEACSCAQCGSSAAWEGDDNRAVESDDACASAASEAWEADDAGAENDAREGRDDSGDGASEADDEAWEVFGDDDFDDHDDDDDDQFDDDDDDDDDDDWLDDHDYGDYDGFALAAFDNRTIGWVGLGGNCGNVGNISVRKNKDGETPFSDAQLRKLCRAARLADGFGREALRVFNGIWKKKRTKNKRKAWKGNAAIVRWMGNKLLSRRQMRVTRRRVRRISSRLSRRQKFVIVQHQDGTRSWQCEADDRAYANPSGRRIFLCPAFWSDGNDYDRARTIIHEMTHLLGWGHAYLDGKPVKSTSTDFLRAQDLASRRPIAARHNPVNYSWLLMELSCGRTFSKCKKPV